MTAITKRALLATLAMLALAPAASAQCAPDAELAAGRAVGEAYLAAHPGADAASIAAELAPNGLCEETIAGLRARIQADFRDGRLFAFRGWRLSRTEAQLFALLAAG